MPLLKNSLSVRRMADANGMVAIVAEPLEGHNDQQAARDLKALGAIHIEVLAPAYISARIPIEALGAVQKLMSITVKRPSEALAS